MRKIIFSLFFINFIFGSELFDSDDLIDIENCDWADDSNEKEDSESKLDKSDERFSYESDDEFGEFVSAIQKDSDNLDEFMEQSSDEPGNCTKNNDKSILSKLFEFCCCCSCLGRKK